jgi:hypothetical protein
LKSTILGFEYKKTTAIIGGTAYDVNYYTIENGRDETSILPSIIIGNV